jgi:hypothetical protein
MNKQPEALRLADDCDLGMVNFENVAAELRRLHEVNKQLLEACHEAIALFDDYQQCFEAIGTYEVLNQAIDKAEGV